MDRFKYRPRISAFAQQHHALDHRWIIDDSAIRLMIGSRHGAEQNFRACCTSAPMSLTLSAVPARCRQDGVVQYPARWVEADGANVELLSSSSMSSPPALKLLLVTVLDLANAQP